MPVINNGFHCNIAGNIPQCFVPSFSSCYMMKNTVQDHMQISSVHSHSAAFIHSSKSSWMIKHTHSIRSHAIYRRIDHIGKTAQCNISKTHMDREFISCCRKNLCPKFTETFIDIFFHSRHILLFFILFLPVTIQKFSFSLEIFYVVHSSKNLKVPFYVFLMPNQSLLQSHLL